jgi:hypothetical protein
VVEEVLTVNVVYVTPGGVGTASMAKLHAAPASSPEQANETFPLNPPSSCTVIVDVPLCPAWTEMEVGLRESVKLCGMVYAALATALVE